jgi:hypothetical protein
MKAGLLSILVALIASLGGCISQAMQEHTQMPAPQQPAVADPGKPKVLVELFTSEGCSSCPPADKVLTFLEHEPVVPNANIITLGFHVDYWNTSRWKDRFSSNLYTKRQEAYARNFKTGSTYTPQMVIDGGRELVGSNSGGAVEAIGKLADLPKGIVSIALNKGQLHIKAEKLPEHSDATIYLAVAEGKLSSSVSGGENTGSKLEHSSVVRQLTIIGDITGKENDFSLEQAIPTDAGWKQENLKYVVFVQDNTTLKVLAVGQVF